MPGLSNKRKQQLKGSFRDNISEFLYGKDPYNYLKFNIMRDLDTTTLNGLEQCYIWQLFTVLLTPHIDKINKLVQQYVKRSNFELSLDNDETIQTMFKALNDALREDGVRLSFKNIMVGYTLETAVLNIAEYICSERRIDNKYTLRHYQAQAGKVVLDEKLQEDVSNDMYIIESYETLADGKWKIRDLKNTCEFFGLPSEGTKQILFDRISKHFTSQKRSKVNRDLQRQASAENPRPKAASKTTPKATSKPEPKATLNTRKEAASPGAAARPKSVRKPAPAVGGEKKNSRLANGDACKKVLRVAPVRAKPMAATIKRISEKRV